PKVIREAAYRRMIERPHCGYESRKLFFQGAAIRRFVKTSGAFPGEKRAFRSEKIALNPHFVRGEAVTIDCVMGLIGISKRRVQDYLKRGILKKIPCGYRTVLITSDSVQNLLYCRITDAWRRLGDAARRFETARKKWEKCEAAKAPT